MVPSDSQGLRPCVPHRHILILGQLKPPAQPANRTSTNTKPVELRAMQQCLENGREQALNYKFTFLDVPTPARG